VLRNRLDGISPRDVSAFVSVPLVLLAVAFAASVVPVRRAVKLDAVTALRSE
jgi:ABC-type lipoprotein release transport system permease subunit